MFAIAVNDVVGGGNKPGSGDSIAQLPMRRPDPVDGRNASGFERRLQRGHVVHGQRALAHVSTLYALHSRGEQSHPADHRRRILVHGRDPGESGGAPIHGQRGQNRRGHSLQGVVGRLHGVHEADHQDGHAVGLLPGRGFRRSEAVVAEQRGHDREHQEREAAQARSQSASSISAHRGRRRGRPTPIGRPFGRDAVPKAAQDRVQANLSEPVGVRRGPRGKVRLVDGESVPLGDGSINHHTHVSHHFVLIKQPQRHERSSPLPTESRILQPIALSLLDLDRGEAQRGAADATIYESGWAAGGNGPNYDHKKTPIVKQSR